MAVDRRNLITKEEREALLKVTDVYTPPKAERGGDIVEPFNFYSLGYFDYFAKFKFENFCVELSNNIGKNILKVHPKASVSLASVEKINFIGPVYENLKDKSFIRIGSLTKEAGFVTLCFERKLIFLLLDYLLGSLKSESKELKSNLTSVEEIIFNEHILNNFLESINKDISELLGRDSLLQMEANEGFKSSLMKTFEQKMASSPVWVSIFDISIEGKTGTFVALFQEKIADSIVIQSSTKSTKKDKEESLEPSIQAFYETMLELSVGLPPIRIAKKKIMEIVENSVIISDVPKEQQLSIFVNDSRVVDCSVGAYKGRQVAKIL